jgi:pilus assembly protein CpaE
VTGGAIKAVVAVDEGVNHDLLQNALPSGPDFRVVQVVQGLEESRASAGDGQANLLLVATGGYSDKALLFIKDAVKERPDRPVVVLCEGRPNGFVSRVFEAGADDIVVLPDMQPTLNGSLATEVLFALQKTVARRSSLTPGAGAGDLICVVGPKGGIGKTLTSVNLGVTLAKRGARVVVVDLDLQFGDVGLALGLRPDKTIYDLATSGGSIDEEKVEAYLADHESGARILLAPRRPDHAGAIAVDFLADLYRTLRLTNDYVIVDTPPGFTPEVIATIDASSHLCMVGMLDALALKNTKLGLETLELMGYDSTRISLVLNRADSDVGVRAQDVAEIVGRNADILIPSHREIARSTNAGTPIALSQPGSAAARGFAALADYYRREEERSDNGFEAKPRRRRRLLPFGRRAR